MRHTSHPSRPLNMQITIAVYSTLLLVSSSWAVPKKLTKTRTPETRYYTGQTHQQGQGGLQPQVVPSGGIPNSQVGGSRPTISVQPQLQGHGGSQSQGIHSGQTGFNPGLNSGIGFPTKQVGGNRPIRPVQPINQGGIPIQPIKQTGFPIQPINQGSIPIQPIKQTGFPIQPINQGGIPIQPINQGGIPIQPINQGGIPIQPINQGGIPIQPINQGGIPIQPINQGGIPIQPINQGGIPIQPVKQLGVPVIPVQPLQVPGVSIAFPTSGGYQQTPTQGQIISANIKTAGQIAATQGCKKWCKLPAPFDTQYACCDIRPGFCPTRRPSCTRTGGPQPCYFDSQCSNNQDKCCEDACFPGQKICKPAEFSSPINSYSG